MLPVYSLRRFRAGRIPFAAIAGLILLLGLSTATASAAAAQDISFEQLFSARECVTLYVHDGWIYGGLSDGGIFSWRQDDPEITRRWTTVEGMTTNNVTDIYWSGGRWLPRELRHRHAAGKNRDPGLRRAWHQHRRRTCRTDSIAAARAARLPRHLGALAAAWSGQLRPRSA